MRTISCVVAAVVVFTASCCFGQKLYSQNFDIDDTANWTVNTGPTDQVAEFFYDYSLLGIPSAPRSTNGTTRGMRLRANLEAAVFAGFSVSPNDKSFEGNYSLQFDWWANYVGPLDTGAAGSSMLSTVGILTSGTFSSYPGAADGVYFAATGDGGSSSDYRAYSSERNISYQLPHLDSTIDGHAVHEAGSRDHAAEYYTTNFPGGFTAPEVQMDLYPDQTTGATPAGSMGFTWHQVKIQKDGRLVRWYVNDILLITVDTTEFTVPTGGTNILFGHADINATIGVNPAYSDLTFTLIDNVRVIDDDALPGDANLDKKVDVADLGILASNWQLAGEWEQADFDSTGFVDVADLGILASNWQAGVGDLLGPSFADALASVGLGAAAVPEPSALAGLLGAVLVCTRRTKRR